jgi:hypothetical protein
MAQTVPFGISAPSAERAHEAAQANTIPWFVWSGIISVSSICFGLYWDISWHMTIGRDTFWTPAHLLVQFGGILAAVTCTYLIFSTTFSHDPAAQTSSVKVWGFRGPLGAFLTAWGGVTMVTSAPFDNWWHNAYGLDVKIISPPHTLLILGIRAIDVGMLFLILAAMNRASDAGDANFKTLRGMLLYLGGMLLGGQMFFIMEYTWDVMLHRMLAYVCLAIAVPVVMATISQASRFRWAATTISALYLVFLISLILILPLFAAQPKLGPVYFPVTHFVPPKFPILLIVPALALDLFWQRVTSWKLWQIALVSGVIFVAVIFAVEWPFANFLMSHASENRFFGTIYFDYNSRPYGPDRMRQFFHPDSGVAVWLGLAKASVYAAISTWLGLIFGRWMRGVQR